MKLVNLPDAQVFAVVPTEPVPSTEGRILAFDGLIVILSNPPSCKTRFPPTVATPVTFRYCASEYVTVVKPALILASAIVVTPVTFK